jgi:hypothetical protein
MMSDPAASSRARPLQMEIAAVAVGPESRVRHEAEHSDPVIHRVGLDPHRDLGHRHIEYLIQLKEGIG